MKTIRFYLVLFVTWMVGLISSFAAVDDTFTANTTEGVAVTYKVLTEDGTTGTVQVGNGSETSGAQAIDYNTEGAITIPASVTNNGVTYTVTQIDYNAFYNCSYITSVTIPSTVATIKNGAFLNSI